MKQSIIEEVGIGQKHIVEERFNKIRKNIKKFNGGLLKYKTVNLGNGKRFQVMYNGVIHTELTLLTDRYTHTLYRTTY